ncbi:MAG: DUF2474 domain-containing protein [Alphaproteobacteria bacterium]|jgi:hypothetical protein|nr:DUF2474 domain-containing protein [Alphaproteobacteria bacterium]
MAEDQGHPAGDSERQGTWRRLAWFVGLYVAGLLTMAAVTYSLRLMIV